MMKDDGVVLWDVSDGVQSLAGFRSDFYVLRASRRLGKNLT